MTKKTAKYTNEVYEIILKTEYTGISSTNIAKELEIKPHCVKQPILGLKRKNLIYSRISLELKENGDPDGRKVIYHAIIYKRRLLITSNQLATINKIRIGRKISEVGK